MARTSSLATARDAALCLLQPYSEARAVCMVCRSFLQDSSAGAAVPVEIAATDAAVEVLLPDDCPAIERAGHVAACALLGIKVVFILAEGKFLDPRLPVDRIVAVTDHINLLGDSPLIGPYDVSLGRRFPDMSQPFSQNLLALASIGADFPACTYASWSLDKRLDAHSREQLLHVGVGAAGPWIGPELLGAKQSSMEVLAFVAPAGAHYEVAVRSGGGDSSYYSQFRKAVAKIMMQLCAKP